MASYDSHLERYELFTATATVAAHASYVEPGFRQRDVKFLMELFSNWIETSLDGYAVNVKNTQLARYLTNLTGEGYARKITRKGYPHYRLTRIGLIELLTRVTHKSYLSAREQFFFLFYFIDNYGPRIEALVRAEGKEFPYALRLELESLLDIKSLLSREIDNAKRELSKLKVRIEECEQTSKHISAKLAEGEYLNDVIKQVENLYPYELNSQKPLTELMNEIPEDSQQWELQTGTLQRIKQIWQPGYAMLTAYIKELENLLESVKDDK